MLLTGWGCDRVWVSTVWPSASLAPSVGPGQCLSSVCGWGQCRGPDRCWELKIVTNHTTGHGPCPLSCSWCTLRPTHVSSGCTAHHPEESPGPDSAHNTLAPLLTHVGSSQLCQRLPAPWSRPRARAAQHSITGCTLHTGRVAASAPGLRCSPGHSRHPD